MFDPQILGKPLTLGERAFTVIGILPEGVDYPGGIDAILPAPPEVQS